MILLATMHVYYDLKIFSSRNYKKLPSGVGIGRLHKCIQVLQRRSDISAKGACFREGLRKADVKNNTAYFENIVW